MPVKVIIDADPGTDDALALMMALNSPQMEVLGVTTVGGNARVAHTTPNALRLLSHLGRRDVPVSAGAMRPLSGRYHFGYYFHGPGGMTTRLPPTRVQPHPLRATDFIVAVAGRNRGELVIVALGPLTNVARALRREPRLREWLKGIVVMGGAVGRPGNVTEHAEFNIYNDPRAAHEVFSSGVRTTLVPLDLCVRTAFMAGGGPWVPGESPAATLANRILSGWFALHPDRNAYDLCDPLAMAAALKPRLLEYRQASVTVELADLDRRGQTTALYGAGDVQVAMDVDVEASLALIRERLAG